MAEEDNHIITDQDSSKKKKKKKNKTKIEEEEAIPMEALNPEEEEEPQKKKKKKKKRNQEEDTIPTYETPSIEMKIQLISDQKEKIAPIVGYFPSGFNPTKSEEEDGENGVEVKAFTKKPNRLELVVSPKDAKVKFVGNSHSGEAAFSQACGYALCVVDRDTHTIQIVPIASNKILRLEPVFGATHSHDEQVKELNEEDTGVKKLDRLNLTNSYGTKKAIRQAKKDANLNRTEDATSQKALDDKLGEVQVNVEASGTNSAIPARNIPPHDPDADTPERAYPLDKIILKGEWAYLRDILDLVESDDKIKAGSYPCFVVNRIRKSWKIEVEEEKKKKKLDEEETKLACIFSYISYLVKFKEQLSKQHASTSARIPPALCSKFSALFGKSGSQSSSRSTDEKTDLLVSYVLVLTLIADGYLTDPADIASDLKMNKLALYKYYDNLGCKPKMIQKVKHYTLPAPLNLPKLNPRKRRR